MSEKTKRVLLICSCAVSAVLLAAASYFCYSKEQLFKKDTHIKVDVKLPDGLGQDAHQFRVIIENQRQDINPTAMPNSL